MLISTISIIGILVIVIAFGLLHRFRNPVGYYHGSFIVRGPIDKLQKEELVKLLTLNPQYSRLNWRTELGEREGLRLIQWPQADFKELTDNAGVALILSFDRAGSFFRELNHGELSWTLLTHDGFNAPITHDLVNINPKDLTLC